MGQSSFDTRTIHEHPKFWREVDHSLKKLGIAHGAWQHEMGPSQYEINFLHTDALTAADTVLLFRYVMRAIATRHGLMPVFMAKPLSQQFGSSMHVHHSIIDASGQNIFCDAKGNDSPKLMHFMGGLQALVPEWMLCLAPHLNSWRRYVIHSGAPISTDWGVDNRSAAFRIPEGGPLTRRIENRLPGSDANPYLALAASLAAGLYGLDSQAEPRVALLGSAYDQPLVPKESRLPSGMESAIRALSESESAKQYFGEAFLYLFTEIKRSEFLNAMSEITPWDRRYLSRLI